VCDTLRVRRPPRDLIGALLRAYAAGAFPMADPDTGEVGFYTADPRAVLPLDGRFHEPRTVARDLRRKRFTLRADTAFDRVVAGCAAPRRGQTAEETWLDDRLRAWAVGLFEAGHAHSLEAWASDGSRDLLVGGVYGVSIGSAFFGESMFHAARPRRADGSRDPADGTGASSVCLVALVRHLRACGYTVFDAQIPNAHTERFGLIELPLADYRETLERAVAEPDAWRPYEPGR